MSRKTKVLLLTDVRNVGRMGEIASVKPGYARNFLLPFGKADLLTAKAYRMQIRLKEERAELAIREKEVAEKLSKELKDVYLKIVVKVDVAGNMYGSVGAQDVARLLVEKGYSSLERRDILLPHTLKKLGTYRVDVRLKEGVLASVHLEIASDRPVISPKVEPIIQAETEGQEDIQKEEK